jgi:hypothetical protein
MHVVLSVPESDSTAEGIEFTRTKRPRPPSRNANMNFTLRKVGASPLPEVIDLLLADIAIRVQLSKTDYDKAVARFGVMQE